jgi:hypothetical protein
VSNPLVAQRQDSTTWHSGINILDDAAGVYDGVQSGRADLSGDKWKRPRITGKCKD